jgi:hypothetical protein
VGARCRYDNQQIEWYGVFRASGGLMLASLASVRVQPSRPLWLRNARFDLLWLLGLPALGTSLALIAFPGLAALAWPVYAVTTGQPHFGATFARVYFESSELRRWWRAAVMLPGYLLAAVLLVLGLGGEFGLAALVTLVFAWGYWHYTRQAFGVARHYQRRLPDADLWDRRLLWLAIHVPPSAAAIWFLSRLPETLLELPVLRLPLAAEIVLPLVVLAPLALLPALARAGLGCGAGVRDRVDLLTALLTTAVFYATLVFTPSALAAHLGVSIWHTVQYHAFVYHAQVQRYADPSRPGLLPWLLAQGYRWRYFIFLGVLAFCVFSFPPHLARVVGLGEAAAVMVLVVVWVVVNLHHYLLDGWIWAAPKRAASASVTA